MAYFTVVLGMQYTHFKLFSLKSFLMLIIYNAARATILYRYTMYTIVQYNVSYTIVLCILLWFSVKYFNGRYNIH
jgi:hypothetical protein